MTADKPLDAGTGRLVASFDPSTAAWLSIGAPHPELGFVELSAMPAFDERERGDPEATRRYRQQMTRVEHAFLAVEIDGEAPHLEADLRDPARPHWNGPSVEVEVEAVPDATSIRQLWRLGGRAAVRIGLRGRLDRPALAEITELDPPPPTGLRTTVSTDDRDARLDNGVANAAVRISGVRVTWEHDGGGMVASAVAEGPVELSIEAGIEPLAAAEPPCDTSTPSGDRLVARAIAYVRGCTALRVGPGERVILTDHRLLPLSWTRDAYWQALALLACDGPGDRQRVADHLRWLWRRCERPDGRWVRSHDANGRRKDLAFQADQQLYPIVELADYWRLTGDLPSGVDWSVELTRAWSAAMDEVDDRTGLIASAENAADDPATAPFIAASQILLWYTALRLAEVAGDSGVGPPPAALRDVAGAVRDAFDTQLASGAVWPYAVDGFGGRVTYHDANDLPIALAPVWGFCGVDEPDWRATMAFAFSSDNPAWVDGRRAGLGSLHTAGAWTLGDIQRWLWASLIGDTSAADAARQRLDDVSFADGMLPEAYGAGADDASRVRHWFAWPGAALAALDTLERSGRLADLAVR